MKHTEVDTEHWLTLKIGQQMTSDGSAFYYVKLNDKKVFEKQNKQPIVMENLYLYVSSDYWEAADAVIRNLEYWTDQGSPVPCRQTNLKTVPVVPARYRQKTGTCEPWDRSYTNYSYSNDNCRGTLNIYNSRRHCLH